MIPDPKPIISEPWYWSDVDFVKQLYRELPFNHSLLKTRVRSIARRQDDDIFLFAIDHEEYKFLYAHLWMGCGTPPLKYYRDWEDVYSNLISPDEKWWIEEENKT